MATVIQVNCLDQTLTITNSPEIASGGVNEDQVTFTFCSKWDGMTKTAVFYRDSAHVYNVLLDANNTAVIPSEVLQTDGKFYFGVFGVLGNVTRTSEVLQYAVKAGAITTGTTPPTPTPDIYQQILAAYNTSNANYQEMLTDFNTLPYVNYVDGEGIDVPVPVLSNVTLWEGENPVRQETTNTPIELEIPLISKYKMIVIVLTKDGTTSKEACGVCYSHSCFDLGNSNIFQLSSVNQGIASFNDHSFDRFYFGAYTDNTNDTLTINQLFYENKGVWDRAYLHKIIGIC